MRNQTYRERDDIMKIAVSTDGQDLGSRVSPVFGRCPYFVMIEMEDNEIINFQVLENPAISQSSGAGTAAAQLVGDEGAEVIISGAVGPRAFTALKKWDILIYRAEPGSVEENVGKMLQGKLEEVESPTSPSGMGIGD